MPEEVAIQARDMSRELFFVTKGVLELYKENTVVRVLRAESEAPSAAGEIAFFMSIAQPYTVACAAKGDATCMVLSKVEFEEIVRSYPEQQACIPNAVPGVAGVHPERVPNAAGVRSGLGVERESGSARFRAVPWALGRPPKSG